VWSYRLPYNITALPITFEGNDGRQYVAVTAARGGNGAEDSGDEGVFVFALPRH
jgi:glucose dehydrogenase